MTDLNSTPEQIFSAIISGRCDTSDFEQWVMNQRADAWADCYKDMSKYREKNHEQIQGEKS